MTTKNILQAFRVAGLLHEFSALPARAVVPDKGLQLGLCDLAAWPAGGDAHRLRWLRTAYRQGRAGVPACRACRPACDAVGPLIKAGATVPSLSAQAAVQQVGLTCALYCVQILANPQDFDWQPTQRQDSTRRCGVPPNAVPSGVDVCRRILYPCFNRCVGLCNYISLSQARHTSCAEQQSDRLPSVQL